MTQPPEKKGRIDLSLWPEKSDVANLLGISNRSIERMQKRGELKTRRKRIPGSRPVLVFDPDDVQKAKQTQLEYAAARARSVNTMSSADIEFTERQKEMLNKAANPRIYISLDDSAREFAERILNELQLMRNSQERVILTIRDANDLGFRPSVVRTLIKDGQLRNFGTLRTPRVSKAELVALIDSPPPVMLFEAKAEPPQLKKARERVLNAPRGRTRVDRVDSRTLITGT